MVSAFQTGRVFNGGATDIGWATSTNGGVSWTHGFLPGTSREAMQPGPFFSVSDPSVAYDARDGAWIISWLGAHFSGGGIVDVMVSRSTDGGLTWGAPVTVAATGVFYDKNWTACDNTPASPFYGHCYTEFDNASAGDLELMSTSADGGLTWGAPTPTADNVHGLGGQPVVQPNGRVVVPFEGLSGAAASAPSAPTTAARPGTPPCRSRPASAHSVPGVRTSPLPSAEINRDGTVYVVWQDNRFEPGGTANDIVLSTSADGTTWSPVSRIPLDPVGSNVDHFIPGLAVDRTSAGAEHRTRARPTTSTQTRRLRRHHLPDPGRLLLLARQRADVEHTADTQRPDAAGLARPHHPGRHGRRLHLHLVPGRAAAGARRLRDRFRAHRRRPAQRTDVQRR